MRSQTPDQGAALLKPRLVISRELWLNKLLPLVMMCPMEINGFGYVHVELGPNGERVIRIDDVFVLSQVVTMGTANTVQEAIQAHQLEMIRNDIPGETWRLQWHKHPGSVYCSGTDTKSIEDWTGDWLVSLVVNDQQEAYARLDTFRNDGLRIGVELTLEVEDVIPDEALDWARSEIAAKVSTPRQRILRRPTTRPVVPVTNAPASFVKAPGDGTLVDPGPAVAYLTEA